MFFTRTQFESVHPKMVHSANNIRMRSNEDGGLRTQIISAGTATINHQSHRTTAQMEALLTFPTMHFYQIAKMTRNPLIFMHGGRVQSRRKIILSEL